MRYRALACDYDGTLAHHGVVEEKTLRALHRAKTGGARLLMVTGRELRDLQAVCPHLKVFDLVVAENGALLYRPEIAEARALGPSPPTSLLDALYRKGVRPLSAGQVILATWEPHEAAVLEAIRELGLEYQIIFNKGAVMILPSGINKASGLKVALQELDLEPREVVGVGDAENDHAMLELCGFSAAVANALPSVKERVDWVASATHGAGVVELIDYLSEREHSRPGSPATHQFSAALPGPSE
jgi:hydroxymethylpyrimidine pyrophosphatase-like HAD family hydrolase